MMPAPQIIMLALFIKVSSVIVKVMSRTYNNISSDFSHQGREFFVACIVFIKLLHSPDVLWRKAFYSSKARLDNP
jgi:hypothetical protein